MNKILLSVLSLLILCVGCSKPLESREYDEGQVVLEFAVKLEQEEINYKHKFEKEKKTISKE